MARKRSGRAALVSLVMTTCAFWGCSARSNYGGSAPYRCVFNNGMLTEVQDPEEVTETDTLLFIERVGRGTDQQDKIASHQWVVDREHFVFRGQRYFVGRSGLRRNEIPAQATARRIVPVGEHDNVTLYAWRGTEVADPILRLFVRTGKSPCEIRQYRHVSEIRD